MSKNQKQRKNPIKTTQNSGAFNRRGVILLAAALTALAIGGCSLNFRMTGTPDTSDTTVPPHTSPEDTSDAGETVAPVTDESAPPDSAPDSTTTAPVSGGSTSAIPVVITPDPMDTIAPDTFDDDPARVTYHPLEETTAPEEETFVRVPESAAVEDSYFSDAVFIGDSRTVGLSLYAGLKSNYYSQQGLNVSSVMSTAFVPAADGETKLTLAEALEAHPEFTKVYISFGINEIGWPSADSFIRTYGTLMDLVQEKLPHACIYVQEILPMCKVTAENERYSAMGGNTTVATYNERLYKLCEEKGAYYVALTEVFADENGDLNVTDSGDGIHLGVASSKTWISYLKTHTVPQTNS